jgi:predicted AAA+ superfamily ATPase
MFSIDCLIELLDAKESILLVAPRRVGKTSLMREMLQRLDSRCEDFGLFVDVQD